MYSNRTTGEKKCWGVHICVSQRLTPVYGNEPFGVCFFVLCSLTQAVAAGQPHRHTGSPQPPLPRSRYLCRSSSHRQLPLNEPQSTHTRGHIQFVHRLCVTIMISELFFRRYLKEIQSITFFIVLGWGTDVSGAQLCTGCHILLRLTDVIVNQ